MKKYLFILAFITSFCKAQETFKEQNLGFEIEKPSGWIIAEKDKALENLKEHIKLPEAQLQQILQTNRGTLEIATFYKYPIQSRKGVIPTIKVNLRSNPAKSFEIFRPMIESSFQKFSEIFPDFSFIEKPTTVKIDGKDCVYCVFNYTLKANNGSEKVRTFLYAVPMSGTFYQITFMDTEKDDTRLEFEKAIKSIRL